MNIILHEPIGVSGADCPLELPFLMAAWLAPALAAGDCIVFKPSSTTSPSVLTLVKLIGHLLPPRRAERGHRRRLPGRASICWTTPASASWPSPAPPKWAWTWPRRPPTSSSPPPWNWAARVPTSSSRTATGSALLDGLQLGILFNQGQVCCAGSRVFVQESIYDKFVDAAVKAFNNINVGNPLT